MNDNSIFRAQPEDDPARSPAATELTPAQMVPFYLQLPDSASDAEKGVAAQQISKAIIGVDDASGRMWNNKPFRDGAAYLDFMRSMIKRGDIWDYVATPELKAFSAADEAGKIRLAREKLDTKSRQRTVKIEDKVYGVYGQRDEGMTDATPEERAANARLREEKLKKDGRNLVSRGFPLDLTAADTMKPARTDEDIQADRALVDAWATRRDDKKMVSEYNNKLSRDNVAAVWLGLKGSVSPRAQEIMTDVFANGKMSAANLGKFQALEEEEQEVVAHMSSLSRGGEAPPPGFFNAMGDAGVGLVNQLVTTGPNASRKIYNLALNVADREEMNIEARQRQRLMEAMDDATWLKPSGADHGYAAKSVIGAVSTLPYMAVAMIPYVGTSIIALDAMQRFEDRVAADGGDVQQGPAWEAQKIIFGATYAAVEKMSAIPIFKEGGDIALRTAMVSIFTKHGARAAGKIAVHLGKQTLVESLEEAVQEAVEEYAVSTGLHLDQKMSRSIRAGVKEFGETLGTMALVSGVGVGRQGVQARSTKGRASLADEVINSQRRESFLMGMDPYRGVQSAEERILADAVGAATMQRYQGVWDKGGRRALEKRGLSPDQAAQLDYVFSGTRDQAAAEKTIRQRNARVADTKNQDLTPDTVRRVVRRHKNPADGAAALQRLGFAERDAETVANYFAQEATYRQATDQVLASIRQSQSAAWQSPDAQAERVSEATDIVTETQPLRALYQRAGSREGAVKAFQEIGFKPDQAQAMAQAFDRERGLATSPEAAAAFKSLYLGMSEEMSVEERMARMSGFEAAPAPEHGEGAVRLTIRDSGGDPAALVSVIYQPGSTTAFDPESAHAGEAVEQATGGVITEAEWNALPPERRAELAATFNIRAMGGFTLTAADDPTVQATAEQADTIIGTFDVAETAPSATLYHEATHAWAAVMRRAGKLTDADVKKLQAAYGVAEGDPNWFNEERLAADIREIGAAADFAPDKGYVRTFVDAVRRMAGMARTEQTMRKGAEGARQKLYEAVIYGGSFADVGDLAALPGPAGKADEKVGPGSADASDPLTGAAAASKAATPSPAADATDATATPPAAGTPPPAADARPARTAAPNARQRVNWSAATPQGNVRVGGYWAVAPRSRFITDTDPRYDHSLQGRTRDATRGSAEQVAAIAAPGTFDALRLLDAPDTAGGAPIVVPVQLVDPDGKSREYFMVLSGNGRFRALDLVDADNRGDEYRNPVQSFADQEQLPYDPADMTAEAAPRLVRVLNKKPVDMTLQKIAELSNQNAVLQMTHAERAVADSELILDADTAGLFSANKDGLPSRTGSDEFFAWFARATGDASLSDSQGRPTDTARERARRAMLALAIGRGKRGKDTVRAFTEQSESLGLERQSAALLMAGGSIAAIEATKPQYALADEMSRAAAALLEIATAKKAGKIADAASHIAQGDMLDAMPPAAAEVLRLLDSARPAEWMTEAFRRYADLVSKIDTETGDMFGAPLASKESVLAKALADTEPTTGTRYSLAIDIAARRYALETNMPAEGERLVAEQLEFILPRNPERARSATCDVFANMDSPEAWKDAFDASGDTVSRVIHEFYMQGDKQRFPFWHEGKSLHGLKVKTPQDAAALLMPLRSPYQESMKAIYLDGNNRVLGVEVSTVGLLNLSPVHPRETFIKGVKVGAERIILSHNHPSGDPSPSNEDRQVTRRLEEAGRLIGIKYLDHIITNGTSFYSLRDDAVHTFEGEPAAWDAVPFPQGTAIRGPEPLAQMANVLRQNGGTYAHAVLLDIKSRIVAVSRIALDPKKLQDQKYLADTISREAYRAAVANPTAAMLLDLTVDGVTAADAQAVHRDVNLQGNIMGIELLDTLYNDSGIAKSTHEGTGRALMPLTSKAAETSRRYSLAADVAGYGKTEADTIFDVAAATDPSRVTLVPIRDLRIIGEESPESVDNAERHMRAAMAGEGDRRAPIHAVTNPDGSIDVIDGNATALAAARMGVPAVWADVRPRIPGGQVANSALFVAPRKGTGPRYASLDAVYETAAQVEPEFRTALETAAQAGGFELRMRKGIKGRARAEQKLQQHYNGDTAQLLDILGGTFILDQGQRFGDAIKALETAGLQIIRIKNWYISPDEKTGYRDIKANVRTRSGFVGEVILVERAIFDKKKARGHEIYKEIRDAQVLLKNTAEGNEKTALDAVIDVMNRVSAAYYGASAESYDVLESEFAAASAASLAAQAASSAAMRSTTDQALSSPPVSATISVKSPAQNILPRVLTRFPSIISSLKQSSSPTSSDTISVSLLSQNPISASIPSDHKSSIPYSTGNVNADSADNVNENPVRYSLQTRTLEPLALPDSLADVSAGTSVSALAQTKFKAEHAQHKALRAVQDWGTAEAYARELASGHTAPLLGQYLLAKYHGDIQAAKAVVEKWAKPEEVARIQAQIGDAGDGRVMVMAPAQQQEGNRFNALPRAYALWLASKVGGTVGRGFAKTEDSGAPNTGASAADRLGRDYTFEGGEDVAGAASVILVDDVWTSGQTLWTIFEHLKAINPEAQVAAFATMASGRYGKHIRPTKEQLTAFWEKSKLTPETFKERIGHDHGKLTGSEIQLYRLTGGRGPEAAVAFFGGSLGGDRRDGRGVSQAVGRDPGAGQEGALDVSNPVRYALDLTGREYSKENLLTAFMAHAALTGSPFPSRSTLARLADKIGLASHDYAKLSEAAHRLAAETTDTAIRKAAASNDPDKAAFAIGELARSASAQALVRSGAREGEQLAQASDRISALSEEGVRRAIAAVSGADYAAIERDTDIDIAATILAADPTKFQPQPEGKAAAAAATPIEAAQADAAEASMLTDDEAESTALALTDKQRADIRIKRAERTARIQAYLDAARERAADKRNLAAERRRRQEAMDAEKEGSGAVEGETEGGGGGGDGDAQRAAAAAAAEAEAAAAIPAVPVDFSDRWEAAAFLRIWAFDRFRRDNPGRDYGPRGIEKDRVAVEFYRQTTVRELTQLAKKLLAPGYPRETAIGVIGDIDPGQTANQIERTSSYVLGLINRHAVREQRRSLVKKFRAEIKRQFVKGAEFEELGVDIDRVLTGAIEEDARYVMRVCELSDRALDGEASALQRERDMLNALLAEREGMTGEDGEALTVGGDDMQVRQTQRRLALLDTYGGMVDMMPGEIMDIAGEGLAGFANEAMALRKRWAEYDGWIKTVSEPLIAAIARGVDDPKAKDSPFVDSLIGMLRMRLDYLTRYAEPDKREAGRAAISDFMDMLARGSTDYTIAIQNDTAALNQAMGEIFHKRNGQPDRPAIREYLKRLDSPIPIELASQLTRQGMQGHMTYGQMIQLLASLDQWASYQDNIARHGRRGQAALIRSFMFENPKTNEMQRALSNEDTQLLEWLRRRFYADKREAITRITQRLAGRAVDSPDPLYSPVRMLRTKRSGLHVGGGGAWQPLAGVFSRRVQNKLDFDENASILDMFMDRSRETALLTAYSERGMMIREVLTSAKFQDTVRRFHGQPALNKILEQVEQTLNGGRSRTQTDAQANAAALAMRVTVYTALGYNLNSALKQTTSPVVFANKIGFKDFFKIVTRPTDMKALRHLMASDEYRARYGTGPGSGMDVAQRVAYDSPDTTVFKKFMADWGLSPLRWADWFASIQVAPAVYLDFKSKYLDQGMSEAAADRRAISETFSMIEETQQSGRTENTLAIARKNGILGKAVIMFATAPLQQMQYEVNSMREWRDLVANGGPEANIIEARNRFMRALVINHVIVPMLLNAVTNLFKLVTGDEPDWEKEGFWSQLLIDGLMGSFGRIFFAGALAETSLRALFLRQPPRMGQLVPAEGAIRFAGNLVFPVRDIITWDMDHFRGDLIRVLKSTAVTRLPYTIYENVTEDK